MSLKQAEWFSKTWNGWSGQMPSDDDVINRSPVWYSGLPFILPTPHPPGVCCWSHPFTGAIAKTLLVETLTQTVESPPPSSRHGYGTVTLKNSVFGCLAFSACPLILSHNTHSFSLIPCGWHTPLEKSPDHSPHQHGTQVASHSLAFTRWNIPKKRGKTPGRHKFPLFLDSTSPLHSIPLAREKTNSGR